VTGKGKDRHKHEGKDPAEGATREEESSSTVEQIPPVAAGDDQAILKETPAGEEEKQGPAERQENRVEQESGVPGPAEAHDEETAEGSAAASEEIKPEAVAREAAEESAEKAKADAEAKLAEWRERYLRLAADFDNYRKRQLKDRAEMLMSANEGLVLELLPVLDNMERAITALPNECEGNSNFGSIRKGIELTLRLFQAVLVKYGVEKLTVVGKKFDPYKHEALVQDESSDVKEDTVVEEIEAGYVLNGKVVRPAKVKVARPKP